jgi:predicted nucleotidyltransferase
MNENKFNEELIRIIEFSKNYGADKVILFGSCLDDLNSARDIDIAVSGIKPKDFFKYYGKVSMEIEDEVDIVDLDDLRAYFRQKVISQGKVLYARAA